MLIRSGLKVNMLQVKIKFGFLKVDSQFPLSPSPNSSTRSWLWDTTLFALCHLMLELFIKQNHFQLVKQFSGHCLPNIIIKRWFKEVCGLLNNFL